MTKENLTGKHILITSGSAKEIIDGVRHYANHARPENQGLEAARLLAAHGAKVTLIAPKLRGQVPEGVEVVTTTPSGQPIVSARDLVEATEDYVKRTDDLAAVLHLANSSSIRPAQVSEQKRKVKNEAGHAVPMEVVGNVDAWERLEKASGDKPIVGYQNGQLTATASNTLVDSLVAAATEAHRQAEQTPTRTLSATAPVTEGELAGRKIIITSGPTAEQLTTQGDVITNFSSGKQGHALAESLAGMGAQVTLITGPTYLPDPAHVNISTLHATDARDMRDKVVAQLPADAYIGVAAVADFGMEHPAELHLKDGEPHTLHLAQNPDILQTVGTYASLRPSVVIGFAAETAEQQKLLEYARGKLEKKGADAICANQVGAAIVKRGSDNNQIIWITKEGAEPWEVMDKREAGRAIGSKIAQLLNRKQEHKAAKLVFALPPEEHPNTPVLRRLAEEARAHGAEVVIAQDDAVLEASKGAQALIADVDVSAEMMKQAKASNLHLALVGLHAATQGSTIAAALDESYASLLRNKCTMMLGLLPEGSQPAARAMLITGERGIQPVKGLEATAQAFVSLLQSRIGNHHYRTELETTGLPEAIGGDIAEASWWIQEWAKWSLFPKYESRDEKFPGAEFGFVAKRTGEGTLITARASNKEHPGPEDLVLVKGLDADGTLHVQSAKRKASLNAPLAHLIMQERPEINYIIHSHIFLPEGETVPNLSTPGTKEDWQAIEQAVKSGARIINQPQHGSLILLEKPEDLLPLLKANGLYQHNSELYDLAYARFQSVPDKPTSLERAVEALVLPEQPKVLDLCCGTGASTLALQKLGLTDTEFADGSPSMLAVAEKRIGRKGRLAKLEDLSNIAEQAYDLVTVRQAFAYVKPEDLDAVAQNIARILKPGGRFVFNGFAKIAPGTAKPRDVETEQPNLLIRTREDNQITEMDVLHTQRSEIIDFDKGRWDAVLDVNQFYQHEPERLRAAFEKAGLTFTVQQQGNSVCYIATNRNLRQAQGQEQQQETPVRRAGGGNGR